MEARPGPSHRAPIRASGVLPRTCPSPTPCSRAMGGQRLPLSKALPTPPTPDLGQALHTARCSPKERGWCADAGQREGVGHAPPQSRSSLTSSREPFRPAPSPRPEAFRALSTSSPARGPGWAARARGTKGQTTKQDRLRPRGPREKRVPVLLTPEPPEARLTLRTRQDPEANPSAQDREEEGRLIQEETGILRSGVRGLDGETEAGVTGRDRLS